MAKMYPERLPAEGVKSPAERKLFHLMQEHLPEDYTVLWSIDWTMARSASYGSGARESEIDFFVLHPEKGILVLEVKGGGVGYDGTLHQWYTIDAYSTRHSIRDPFEQAKNGKHTLIRELTQQIPSEDLKKACRGCVFAHAVLVPDIPKARIANRPTRPDEVILDREDLQPETISAAIDGAYAFWKRTGAQPLGRAAVAEIITLYAPSWYVRPLLVNVFEDELAQLNELTEQQFTTLNLLRRQKRVAISGCAGCGKTFLAIEQARRLARRGLRVLVTCYNRNLADWVRRSLAEQAQNDRALDNIEVFNFHRLSSRFCGQAGIPLPADESHIYDEAFAQGLLKASQSVTQRYDAILADEGQDFNDSWWTALLAMLASQEDSLFYVFYDDNQRIYGRYSTYPVPEDHYYPLTINCRTTLKIHDEVMKYYGGADIPECQGPPGREIERVQIVATRGNEINALATLLHRLTHDEGIAIEDIVLLSPLSKAKSRFREGMRIGKQFRLSWDMKGAPVQNTLGCCSIFAFKGLERDVVILAEPEKVMSTSEREQLIYVALSRAKFHLIILGELPYC